ncbi:cyclic nucleotide-binding domain-containing protein [Halobacteriovorax sp. GB3]|uniref:cyclic nucleotide-binding domain-containing protein n=1 Tax=Halobacteriovorax sp. GB3 TaxID=2719615 RepID=UPI00235E1F5F|nr:cyclic nucleotide-binding domain-containing protein [Halobacteriovorax sp. GB3]MDD0854811.1 cyclic nucleotide-binding domain-containing protein [Halobacteriovorax sp. GB3]
MASYENEITNKIDNKETLPEKLDIPTLKYFWQANPLVRNKQTIPKFLRRVEVLKNFSDYQLLILSRFLHHRSFSKGEVIFKEGDIGVGFYFLLGGSAALYSTQDDGSQALIVNLDRGEYFGELSILQDKGTRNASALAGEGCELLGIFKPDLEALIDQHPIVATKLIHSISIIIAHRFYNVTSELKILKQRLKQLEETNAKNNE